MQTFSHYQFYHKVKPILVLFFFLTSFLLITTAQTTRYVVAGGTGNGTSWENASGDLQAIISESSSGNGDSILVAAGNYSPNRRADNPEIISPLDRNNAFVLKSGVQILGGYSADGASRDWVNTPSVLSGKMTTDSVSFMQCYHVVLAVEIDNQAALDGFIIKDGLADGSGNVFVNGASISRNAGGGMYVSSALLFLKNTCIQNNTAELGGGLYLVKSSPVISNTTILANKSTGAGGGGIYLLSHSNPKLFDVTIISNTAPAGSGGGVFVTDTCAPELMRLTINSNSANTTVNGYGGGVFCSNYSNPKLINVQIKGNQARFGAGITNAANSLPVLTNTLIAGNYAVWHGGGIFNWFSSIILTNVTIAGNRCVNGFGGGMLNENDEGDSVLVRNSVIYWNGIGSIYNRFPGVFTPNSPNVRMWHSMVQYYPADNSNSNLDGQNSTSNPNFLISNNNLHFSAPFTFGDFSLKEYSILRDKADTSLYSAGHFPDLSHIKTDLAGNKRRWGGLDIGAYEYYKIFSGNDSTICLGADASFFAGYPSDTLNITYQWQIDRGTGFERISQDSSKYVFDIYTLQIVQPSPQWNGYKYRLAYIRPSDTTYSQTFSLRFGSTWVGYESGHWEDPGNWSCDRLPDENVDVVISRGNITVSSEVYCRTLMLTDGATITVKSGGHIHVQQ